MLAGLNLKMPFLKEPNGDEQTKRDGGHKRPARSLLF